jgi:hypothetical protein
MRIQDLPVRFLISECEAVGDVETVVLLEPLDRL